MVAPARAVASRSLSLVSAATPRAIAPAETVWDLRERPRPPLSGWTPSKVSLAPAAMSALIEAQAQSETAGQGGAIAVRPIDSPPTLQGADRRVSAQIIPFPDRRRRRAQEALSSGKVDLKV